MKMSTPLEIGAATLWLPPTAQTAESAVAAGQLPADQLGVTGYRQLPVSELPAPEMAARAAREALAAAGEQPGALDLLVHAWIYHQGHDFWSPAHYVAATLNAITAEPIGVQQMCNGGAAALEIAATRLLAEPATELALVTTADRFCAPGFDRWQGDYGVWYGDAATAAVLRRADDRPSERLRLLSIATVAAPELEVMHRGRDPFSRTPREHGPSVDVRRTKKAYLTDYGKEAFATTLLRKVRCVVHAGLADAGLAGDDLRLVSIVLPRLGRNARETVYEGALAGLTKAELVDYGAETGHLGAGDAIANLAALETEDVLDEGEFALVLSAGAGFTWSAIVVGRPPAARPDRLRRT